MNRRILGIELRRSVAPWAGFLVAGVALGFLYSFSGPWDKSAEDWTEQWTNAAGWVRSLLNILWPLAIGAGALQGLRDHRSGVGELLASTPRPVLHRALKTLGATAIAVTAGYLLVFAVAAVQVVVNDGYFHLAWVPTLLVGVLGLVAGAWLGIGVGRALPSPLTPPLLALASLVGVTVLTLAGDPASSVGGALPARVSLLSPSMGNVRDVFAIVSDRVSAGQAVWLAGLAATGLLLATALTARRRLLSLLPAVVAAAVALAVLPADRAQDYVFDHAAAELVCQGSICVTRMHEAQLHAGAGQAEEALRLLARLPDHPTAVREVLVGEDEGVRPRSSTEVTATFDDLDLAKKEKLTRRLVAGAGTPTCFSYSKMVTHEDYTKSIRETVARSVAASWFVDSYAPPYPEGSDSYPDAAENNTLAKRTYDSLRALPAGEQLARMSALRSVGLSCQGDQLDALTGGAP
ncbi:hypothetical protein [Umezawaea tangerina]|uniref:hypothetical protein n=1 Tax=Umezawaea tangerina TaxID=84725 RepID=UPI0011B26886|nr:hypothetical protein [Umezawaea tangerina]